MFFFRLKLKGYLQNKLILSFQVYLCNQSNINFRFPFRKFKQKLSDQKHKNKMSSISKNGNSQSIKILQNQFEKLCQTSKFQSIEKNKKNKGRPQQEIQVTSKIHDLTGTNILLDALVAEKKSSKVSIHKKVIPKKEQCKITKGKFMKDEKKEIKLKLCENQKKRDPEENKEDNLFKNKQNRNNQKSIQNKSKKKPKNSKIIQKQIKHKQPYLYIQQNRQRKQERQSDVITKRKTLNNKISNMVIDLRAKDNKDKKVSSNNATKRYFQKQANYIQNKINFTAPASFRQYCIIKGKFVPLQSSTQRKCIDTLLAQTACTSPAFGNRQLQNKSYNQPNQIVLNQKKISYLEKPSIIRHQIGIDAIQVELANYQVLVRAAQEDIGIQYSDRFANHARNSSNLQKQIIEKIKLEAKQSARMEETFQQQKSERAILFDAMMKLQSIELSESQTFAKLNTQQKRHFRNIFSSLLSKMVSPRVDIPQNCSRINDQIKEIEKLKCNKAQIIKNSQADIEDEQLEQLLMMRESKQTNQFNISIRSPQQIDTSMLSVLSILTDIFCYAQINYEESLLQTMNSLYGLSYADKYKCVSKYYSQISYLKNSQKQNDVFSISYRVKAQIFKRQSLNKGLPDSLFFNFMKQLHEAQDGPEIELEINNNRKEARKIDQRSITSTHEKRIQGSNFLEIHNKAIFDCMNELLIPYRPFYLTKGDPFPWTLSPLKCLTFYSIDNQSLETVVEQIQQKLLKYVKMLCGLHIQSNYYVAEKYQQKEENQAWSKDIVFAARRKKLSKAIVDELQNQCLDDPYLQLQIDSTCVLHQVSDLLFDQIICQAATQILYD